MSYVEEMRWRGLVQQLSNPQLEALMRDEALTLYSGFDPSAPTLHVGNLMPILGLRRAQLHGHTPVALVGGATGMIGDPSGKSSERNLISVEEVDRNLAGIRAQLARFIDFDDAILVNNRDWFERMSFLDVLRDVGKHFTVNTMIAKESIRARIEDRDSGISYTEFSYMIIQAYDFLHLYDRHGCRLQIGGSEQWGNITAGISLIRRVRGGDAHALTMPLLLDASGKKFGKTEKGAVFLAAERTSVYDFYQYFLRTDDHSVGQALRFLTLLDRSTIEQLMEQVAVAPQRREAQRVLARELTTMVHGAEQMHRAEAAAEALFGQREPGVVLEGTPTFDLPRSAVAAGQRLVDTLTESGLCKSKHDARRQITGGGIYVNDERVAQPDHRLGLDDVRDGLIVLRRGKKNHVVVRVV